MCDRENQSDRLRQQQSCQQSLEEQEESDHQELKQAIRELEESQQALEEQEEHDHQELRCSMCTGTAATKSTEGI